MNRHLWTAMLVSAGVHAAHAETITVCASGCDYTSINAAIDAAADGDVIQLSAETYAVSSSLRIDAKQLTIAGIPPKNGRITTLDGGGQTEILFIGGKSGVITIEYVTFANGLASDDGGAISVSDQAEVLIRHCTFQANRCPDSGGAISLNNADAVIESSTFRGNQAVSSNQGYGGAIDAANGTTASIRGCLFQENLASQNGGAINVELSSVTIVDCIIRENTADQFGGGIMSLVGESVTVADCMIEANTAGTAGGGIGTYATFPTVRNCAITSNTAGTFGGGIGMQNETLILVDTEICGNTAKVEPQIGGTGEVIDEGGNVIIESCGEPGCLGDLDLNGLVDGADLGAMFLFWGTAVAEADLDGDGSVGPADLGLLLISWGPCP